MKTTPIPNVVVARLDAIKCTPLPEQVLSKIVTDFTSAMAEAEAAIAKNITEETVARDFRAIFSRRKSRAAQPELPVPATDQERAA